MYESTILNYVDFVVQHLGPRVPRNDCEYSAVENLDADIMIGKIDIEVAGPAIPGSKSNRRLGRAYVDLDTSDQGIMKIDVLAEFAKRLR
jgi:hypothetical protein